MLQLKLLVVDSYKFLVSNKRNILCSWQREHAIKDLNTGLGGEGHGKDPEIGTDKTDLGELLCLAQEKVLAAYKSACSKQSDSHFSSSPRQINKRKHI